MHVLGHDIVVLVNGAGWRRSAVVLLGLLVNALLIRQLAHYYFVDTQLRRHADARLVKAVALAPYLAVLAKGLLLVAAPDCALHASVVGMRGTYVLVRHL